jgi:hypothetical protein
MKNPTIGQMIEAGIDSDPGVAHTNPLLRLV